jgi:Holliday junction resolvasome RuvABC endonuclease subunit
MSRIIAIDPGAERLGWAVIDTENDEHRVVGSGIWGLARKPTEDFQPYKLRLIEYWVVKTPKLLREFPTTRLVNELMPAVGGGNFIAATQSELAKTALTVIQAFAIKQLVTVCQIGATSIKASIGGSKKASKAKVRNGVIEALDDPELAAELKRETTGEKPVWDRSDAIATGLAHLGVKVNP